MQIPFPERIPLFPTFMFCAVLCGLQQLNGTSAIFSIGTFLFVFIGTLAFNVAGGFSRPSGAFIFSWVMIAALLGILYKVFLGEPGQSNLLQPERTIEVFASGSVAFLIAAYFNGKIRTKRNFLPKFASDTDLYSASIGCLLLGGVAQVIFMTVTVRSGSLLSAFAQLNDFLPLGMILGVTYEIRRSGGRRSLNLPTLLTGAIIFVGGGIISFSKSGLFAPFACWGVAAAAQRYKMGILQIATLVVSLGLITTYLVPYSQAGRASVTEGAPLSQTIKNNIYFLTRLPELRRFYNESSGETLSNERETGETTFHYYNKPEGLMDRLQMIAPDDAIIDATENGAIFGIEPVLFGFENLIPHVLWPSKPIINFGNIYAHEIGLINDPEDITTGISFSPSGDAYHEAKWVGLFILLPALALMLFWVQDSICGDTRESPIALLIVFISLHSAPEGGTGAFIVGSTISIIGVLLVGWVSAFLMPRVVSIFMGRAKESGGRNTFAIAPNPKRLSSIQSEENALVPPVLPPVYRWSGRVPRV